MCPVLFQVGKFEVHAYGLLLAVSFLLGIWWAMFRAERRGVDRNVIMDLSFLIVICAILGSRLLYVVTHIGEFRGRWLDTINPFQSTGEIGIAGLTMLGGVILAVMAVVLFSLVKKISLLRLCDILAPSFGLGIFITRIGCFLNGCCFGEPTTLPWGMVFPLNSPAGYTLPHEHLHPTQLYSSLYGLIIVLVLVLLDRKPRFDGFITAAFFMLYGFFRFSVDFVRYYEPSVQTRILGTAFTINQIISFGMLVTGAVLMGVLYSRKKHSLKKS